MESLSSVVGYLFGAGAEAPEEVVESAEPSFTIDPDSIIVQTEGDLYKYDGRNEEWAEIKGVGTVFVIIATGEDKFTTKFIITQKTGKPIVFKMLDDNLQLRFDAATNSMNWLVYSEEQCEVLQFVFHDTSLEASVKRTIAIKLIEQHNQVDFSKIIKQEEEDWVIESHEQGKVEADYMEVEEWGDNAEAGFDPEEHEEENVGGFAKAAANSRVVVPQEFNRDVDDSMCHNRAYVLRHNELGADLGLFKHQEKFSDIAGLEYVGKVKVQDNKGNHFKPSKMMPHQRDNKVLFLTEKDPEVISVMDMHKGTIVETWAPGKGKLKDFAPLTKYEQATDNNLIKITTKNAFATIDPRTKEKLVEEYQMKTNPKFTSIATTGVGQWAIGASDGSIRLYNKTMRAKTKLPGLGAGIKHIEVTDDGKWVLATTKTYLVLVPTEMPDSFKLGFDARMGKQKPKPFRLRLRPKDMALFGIKNVDFTPAKFNMGTDTEEKWIVTATGNHIIKWNFERVKRGFLQDYLICARSSNVSSGGFRFNRSAEMLIAETDAVYCQTTKNSGAP